MIAKYKINLSTIDSGSTATTINIPLNMNFQIVDQNEVVEKVFVDVEVEKSINPIVDYEKTRFTPIDKFGNPIDKIIYRVDLDGATTYGGIGFEYDDVKYRKENFKRTFLNLNFYDSDNPLTQHLITNMTLYSELKASDLEPFGTYSGPVGQPKPINQIPITYILENPLLNPIGFSEGYYLYDYKDILNIGDSRYLYMRASFRNAKTGKSTNMMVKNNALAIDSLIHELYTRFILTRTSTGYYYRIDDNYQGNTSTNGSNNITYSQNDVMVNLFQIKAI